MMIVVTKTSIVCATVVGINLPGLIAEVRQCCQKWLVILQKTKFKLNHQSEEETGSAEEQPASNRIDAYTIE